MKQSGLQWKDLKAIAVTVGPGMSSCLAVGVHKAKQYCSLFNLPLVSVNHLEAHALVQETNGDISANIDDQQGYSSGSIGRFSIPIGSIIWRTHSNLTLHGSGSVHSTGWDPR